MRIDKEVVEEEINIEEDLIIAVDKVTFKKKVSCRNIVFENYKRHIDAENINAGNIKAWDIDAGNIDAVDIDAENINAENINAGNINADFVICKSRKKKSEKNTTICKHLIVNRNSFGRKEQMPASFLQEKKNKMNALSFIFGLIFSNYFLFVLIELNNSASITALFITNFVMLSFFCLKILEEKEETK